MDDHGYPAARENEFHLWLLVVESLISLPGSLELGLFDWNAEFRNESLHLNHLDYQTIADFPTLDCYTRSYRELDVIRSTACVCGRVTFKESRAATRAFLAILHCVIAISIARFARCYTLKRDQRLPAASIAEARRTRSGMWEGNSLEPVVHIHRPRRESGPIHRLRGGSS